LLNTQYANLAKWESVVVAEQVNHNGERTVAENSSQNDPVLIKIFELREIPELDAGKQDFRRQSKLPLAAASPRKKILARFFNREDRGHWPGCSRRCEAARAARFH
jgi:hypothetical protein